MKWILLILCLGLVQLRLFVRMTGRTSVICLVSGAVVGAENATVAENMTGIASVAAAESVICLGVGAVNATVAESVICLGVGAVNATVAENMTGLVSVAENMTGLVSANCLVISPVFIF